MPWDDQFETMPVDKLKEFQLKKLKETLEWVYEKLPFYRKKFDERGIKPANIKHLEDIRKLPMTVKNDLRDNYPFGLCAVPMDKVVRVHASSGTTGKPITGPYTAEDLDQWTECMARNLWAAGVRPTDIVQNAYGHGLFTGGLGFHQGACRLGCTVVPTSSGMTERQITLMKDFGSTALFCTPSYALTIAERAEEMKVDDRNLPMRVGVFGAEPWSIAMRDEIEVRMGIKAMEAYGLTELGGPGVSFDCEAQDGLHINEDHYLAEFSQVMVFVNMETVLCLAIERYSGSAELGEAVSLHGLDSHPDLDFVSHGNTPGFGSEHPYSHWEVTVIHFHFLCAFRDGQSIRRGAEEGG